MSFPQKLFLLGQSPGRVLSSWDQHQAGLQQLIQRTLLQAQRVQFQALDASVGHSCQLFLYSSLQLLELLEKVVEAGFLDRSNTTNALVPLPLFRGETWQICYC